MVLSRFAFFPHWKYTIFHSGRFLVVCILAQLFYQTQAKTSRNWRQIACIFQMRIKRTNIKSVPWLIRCRKTEWSEFEILDVPSSKLRKSSFLPVPLIFFIQCAHILFTYIAYFTIQIKDNSVRRFVYDIQAFFHLFPSSSCSRKKNFCWLNWNFLFATRLVHLVWFVVQKFVFIVFVLYHTIRNACSMAMDSGGLLKFHTPYHVQCSMLKLHFG